MLHETSHMLPVQGKCVRHSIVHSAAVSTVRHVAMCWIGYWPRWHKWQETLQAPTAILHLASIEIALYSSKFKKISKFHLVTTARHLPNQSSVFNENLTRHFMFQHCQPMRNHHTEQLQGGNGKINSEKVSGQSSSIQLVHPLYTSMAWLGGAFFKEKPLFGSPNIVYSSHQVSLVEDDCQFVLLV